VVKDGEIVLARAYGERRLGSGESVSIDTVFPIASCTKSFTACCIAMLVDEGKLDWDDPVRMHWPEFKVADPYVTEHATLRDLLCHRTGLVRGDLLGMELGLTRAEMLDRLQFLPQAAPFRSKLTYSNLMYAVLGEVIASKSGLPWHDFVKSRIFVPLAMHSTTADLDSVPVDRRATRHRIYDGSLAPLKTRPWDLMAPAGGIHSTVPDLAQWLKFQLRQGDTATGPLIGRSVMAEMYALVHSIPVDWSPDSSVHAARFVGAGLGWYVRDYRGRKLIQHLGVVVLSNRDWNGLATMLVYDVIDLYVVGPDEALSRGAKWDHWTRHGGPGAMDRARKEVLAMLESNRAAAAPPSLPLAQYAGTYRSKLYGDLEVTERDGNLVVRFGAYSATLEHWSGDSFYAHAVIEPFLDWLVKFQSGPAHAVDSLEIMHVGWKDQDERFDFKRPAP
jgi:CubicO group peptidase (beta-lactamase class C family)